MRKQDPLLLYFFLITISLSLLCSLTLFFMFQAGHFNLHLLQITDGSDPILPAPVPIPAVDHPLPNPPERPLEIVDEPKPVSVDQAGVAEETGSPTGTEKGIEPQTRVATEQREESSPQIVPEQEIIKVVDAVDAAADESDCLDIIEDTTSNREFEVVLWSPPTPRKNAAELRKEKAERKRYEKIERLANEYRTVPLGARTQRQQKNDLELTRLKQEVLTKTPEKILRHRVKTVNGQIVAEQLIWIEDSNQESEQLAKCRRGEIEPEELHGFNVICAFAIKSPEIQSRLQKLKQIHGTLTHQMMRDEIGFDPAPKVGSSP